jgi:hypothetical protein
MGSTHSEPLQALAAAAEPLMAQAQKPGTEATAETQVAARAAAEQD